MKLCINTTHLSYLRLACSALLAVCGFLNSFCDEPPPSGNQRPVVMWISPQDGAQFPAYSTVTLQVSATDPDGSISRVYFLNGTNKVLGATTAPPYSLALYSLAPGNYSFRALAIDNLNLGGSTPIINITVKAGTGTPPPTPPPPAQTYALTVNNGTGSGSYAAGASVSISANAAPAGQTFAQWTGANVANSAAPFTTLSMPAAATTVTATYKPLSYTLTVNGGSGGGNYTAGTTVPITANPPPAGQVFDQWLGGVVADATASSTTLSMPSANAVLTATYKGVPPALPGNPILFVTQIPIGFDFTTVGSTFGNHRPTADSCGRGGDLYIRYADGSVKNLTAAAGYGVATGFQGAQGIAVREPAVHWNGNKALFSMVVGSSIKAFTPSANYWQIYEVTRFGVGETPVITKIPNQPANFNNISPCYGTDGRILFVSDRPRNGQGHLYPQLDEYELAPTTTGVWSLDPATGDLFNLNHTPSGAFSLSIDSFGRVVFVRWDHLQRDQEADIDVDNLLQGLPLPYGTFNYSDESASAAVLVGNRTEVFPEPRATIGNVNGHTFNVFFPWATHEDGTDEETINHLGRHEIGAYLQPSFNNDNNLGYFYNPAVRYNKTYVYNFLHLKEDPTTPGRYYGTDAPEFNSHASGQIVTLNAPQGLDADYVTTSYITDPVTKTPVSPPSTNHSGHFRDPLPLANGSLVVVHATGTDIETQRGVGSDYAFRLKTMWRPGPYWVAYQTLTPGFSKSVSYYTSGGGLISYNGPLWELNPVEVRARPIPQAAKPPLAQPEQQVFDETGVDVAAFQDYLRTNGLALVVSRNVTTRDHADRQQPYNLHVAGTATQTIGAGGKIYDISHLQFFQADQIRGFGMRNTNSQPSAGRRVLAQPLHDTAASTNNLPTSGPVGSVQLGIDGSMAAFLPARRAMTWQLTDPVGSPVVRERYWVTFQPGEIRTCASCHGVNTTDQANHATPVNKPEALRTLLLDWKARVSGP